MHFISPDNKHSALIIIDVQRDFVLSGSSAEIPGTIHPISKFLQKGIEILAIL